MTLVDNQSLIFISFNKCRAFEIVSSLSSAINYNMLLLFLSCRPSSVDAIFLAHALLILQALPVSRLTDCNVVVTLPGSELCMNEGLLTFINYPR